jgi:ATP-dependent DNA helicase RecG
VRIEKYGGLNSTQHRVLEWIHNHEGTQAKEIARTLEIPPDTLDKVISKLVKIKKIERRGSKKSGGYVAS